MSIAAPINEAAKIKAVANSGVMITRNRITIIHTALTNIFDYIRIIIFTRCRGLLVRLLRMRQGLR